jgi:hypothetical protein
MKKVLLLVLLLACTDASDRPTAPEHAAATVQSSGGKIEVVRLDILYGPAFLTISDSTRFCAFSVFASGDVGMRSVDAWACQQIYMSNYTEIERNVTKREQTFLDGR